MNNANKVKRINELYAELQVMLIDPIIIGRLPDVGLEKSTERIVWDRYAIPNPAYYGDTTQPIIFYCGTTPAINNSDTQTK